MKRSETYNLINERRRRSQHRRSECGATNTSLHTLCQWRQHSTVEQIALQSALGARCDQRRSAAITDRSTIGAARAKFSKSGFAFWAFRCRSQCGRSYRNWLAKIHRGSLGGEASSDQVDMYVCSCELVGRLVRWSCRVATHISLVSESRVCSTRVCFRAPANE